MGWRLAVNFEPYRQTYQLLIKNEALHLCGITDAMHIENSISRYDARMAEIPVFRVLQIAPQIQVMRVSCELSPRNFEEMYAAPQFVTSKIESLYDLNVFATKRAEQVLIDKADMSVIEHLEAIKALQSPKQKEIRQKLSQPQEAMERPRLHLVAQLVHYQDAA